MGIFTVFFCLVNRKKRFFCRSLRFHLQRKTVKSPPLKSKLVTYVIDVLHGYRIDSLKTLFVWITITAFEYPNIIWCCFFNYCNIFEGKLFIRRILHRDAFTQSRRNKYTRNWGVYVSYNNFTGILLLEIHNRHITSPKFQVTLVWNTRQTGFEQLFACVLWTHL